MLSTRPVDYWLMCFLQCILGLLKFLSRDFWMTFFVLFRKVWIVSAHRKYWLQTTLSNFDSYSNILKHVCTCPSFFQSTGLELPFLMSFCSEISVGFPKLVQLVHFGYPSNLSSLVWFKLDPKRGCFFCIVWFTSWFFLQLEVFIKSGMQFFQMTPGNGCGGSSWSHLKPKTSCSYLLVVHVLNIKLESLHMCVVENFLRLHLNGFTLIVDIWWPFNWYICEKNKSFNMFGPQSKMRPWCAHRFAGASKLGWVSPASCAIHS